MNKRRKVAKRNKGFPWIGTIGMLLIFMSWFIQKTYDAERAGARQNLDSSKTNILLAAANADMWTARYFELKTRPKPKEKLLLSAAFKALQ